MREMPASRERGLTLIELLVALAIIMLIAAIGYPALQKMIARSNLEGTAQQMMAALRQGRLEAVKRSVPAVAVMDQAARRFTVFVDFHDAGGNPGADLLYNPRVGTNPSNTDYIVADLPLPPQVHLGGPPGDANAVDGFTDRGDGPRAVFQPDGAVEAVGAFRVRDDRQNYLEIRSEPLATARIQLRKWNPSTSPPNWQTRDMKDGKVLWEWY
jgi:prepilin-type N-terminal cleavage/methylation domain-containing protein